jgi:hypothetical protein
MAASMGALQEQLELAAILGRHAGFLRSGAPLEMLSPNYR